MARKKRPKKPIVLTDKERAVLQAIEELGETSTKEEILERANIILKSKKPH
jgi:hypothetical protein